MLTLAASTFLSHPDRLLSLRKLNRQLVQDRDGCPKAGFCELMMKGEVQPRLLQARRNGACIEDPLTCCLAQKAIYQSLIPP